MKKLLLPLAAAVAFVLPATAGAATFSGIVVAKQTSRHAVAVSSAGTVRTVHTRHLGVAIGTRLAVSAKRLSDGTFSATKTTPRGRAKTARIHGVVARHTATGFLVSAGHSMIAVHTRSLADNNPGTTTTAPPVGEIVDVTVNTTSTQLSEDDVQEEGEAQRIELEGTLSAITQPTATSAGDLVLQVGKSTIDVVVPAGTTLPTLNVGDKVMLTALYSGDTFTLATSQHEDDNQGDDDGGDNGGGGGGDG
jgi:hypothetical protein